jgi:ketosteroid isomerase-like protein
MDANANVAALRHAYHRWNETRGGSLDTWMELIDEPFRLISMAGGRPGAEFTCEGCCKDDVGRYLGGLTGQWEMEYFRVDRYLADGDTVVAIGSTAWTNKATGKRMETLKADVWEFRDGKAVSFTEFYDSAGVLEAAMPDAAAPAVA